MRYINKLEAIAYKLIMKITFENSLYINRIKFSNDTLYLNIVYKNDDQSDDYEWKGNKIISQSYGEYKEIEITEAEFEFENIDEIWWDDWWDEDKDRVDLDSIELDNIHWRFDELENLQYNAPKYDVDVNDLNDLNIAEWETALWESSIVLDSDNLSDTNFHLTINIPHDLIKNKIRSMQYRPVHLKGKNIKLKTK